jgi:hypothetical protein
MRLTLVALKDDQIGVQIVAILQRRAPTGSGSLSISW